MYIFVGNLSQQTLGADLRREFEAFGVVDRAAIVTDVATSVSAGYGFVKMASKADTQAAITGIAGKKLHGHLWEIKRTRRVADKDAIARDKQ